MLEPGTRQFSSLSILFSGVRTILKLSSGSPQSQAPWLTFTTKLSVSVKAPYGNPQWKKKTLLKFFGISIQCEKTIRINLLIVLHGIHHLIFFNSAHHIYGPGKNKANSESYPHFLVAAAYPTYPHPLDLLRKF